MLNRSPKVVLHCGDLRAVAQKVVLDLCDQELRDIAEQEFGESEDVYQICLNVRKKPSIWFLAQDGNQQPENIAKEQDRLLKEIYGKHARRQPLLIEMRYGSYSTEESWWSRKRKVS